MPIVMRGRMGASAAVRAGAVLELLATVGACRGDDPPPARPEPPPPIPCDGGADGFSVQDDCAGTGRKCLSGARCAAPLDCANGRCLNGVCAGFTHAMPGYGITGPSPQKMTAADFNGDGRLDFAATTHGNVGFEPAAVVALLQQPAGYFNTRSVAPYAGLDVLAADVDSDGRQDLVVSRLSTPPTIMVYLGNGDGTFHAGIDSHPDRDAAWLAAGDFDRDGHLDACASSWGGGPGFGIVVLQGRGDGTFAPGGFATTSGLIGMLAVADLDSDGRLDIAGANTKGPATLLFGRGDGTFEPPMDVPAGAEMVTLAVADFDRDGRLDLALGGNDGCLVTLLGEGSRRFGRRRVVPADPHPAGIAAADLDGDGAIDLAVSQLATGGSLRLYPGAGDGSFRLGALDQLGNHAGPMLAADINGDALPDLAVLDAFGSGLLLLVNQR